MELILSSKNGVVVLPVVEPDWQEHRAWSLNAFVCYGLDHNRALLGESCVTGIEIPVPPISFILETLLDRNTLCHQFLIAYHSFRYGRRDTRATLAVHLVPRR